MCLNDPAKFKLRREGGYYVGYKIFDTDHRGNLYNPYWSISKPRKTDTWLKAWGATPIDFNFFNGSYKPGFHIFQRLCDAMLNLTVNDIVLKVYFDEIIQQGIQYGNYVIVSKYLWIPSDGKRWSKYIG